MEQTTAKTGEVAWCVCLRRANEEGASRLAPGHGRPWGRVAWVRLRSKVKLSERSKFGGEWLLGAANGGELMRRITGSKDALESSRIEEGGGWSGGSHRSGWGCKAAAVAFRWESESATPTRYGVFDPLRDPADTNHAQEKAARPATPSGTQKARLGRDEGRKVVS